MGYSLWDIITQSAILSRVWFTVWQSGVTVILALLVGGGLAVLERQLRTATPRWFLALCSLIVFLPPLIISTGFIMAYGRVGALNQLIQLLGSAPLQLLYTKATVAAAHSYYNIPLAFLVLRAALANVPQSLEDTAAVCGARGRQVLTDLYWPLIRRPVMACAALIFLYCFTSFIVPLQLGGHQAQTLEVWLYQEIYLYHNYAAAGLIAASQLIILASLVAMLLKLKPTMLTNTGGFNTTTASSPPLIKSKIVLRLYRLVITIFLAGPLMVLVARSMSAISWKNITLLAQSQFGLGLGRSLLIATSALSLALLLVWLLRLPNTLTLTLVAISPVTLTFVWFFVLGKGNISLIAAFVVILLPVVGVLFQTVRARQPKFLTRTAELLGASPLQVRLLEWRLTQPAVRRSVALGSIIVLGDATLSSLLSQADKPLAMPVVMGFIASYRFELGSLALSVLLLSFSILLMLAYAHDRES